MTTAFTRRRAILAAGAGLLLPIAVGAQPAGKIAVIGILHPGFPPPSPPLYATTALENGLRELGYVAGKTIRYEYLYGRGNPDVMPGLAAELARRKVDVIVCMGTASNNAAKAATRTIPIVGTDTTVDPVAGGLVASLAKPGGNITGLFFDFRELMGKLLELLTETVPGIKRAAALRDTASSQFQLDALAAAAKAASIAIEVVAMKEAAQLEALLGAALRNRPQALIQLPSPVVNQSSARIAKFTKAHRLPSISIFDNFPKAGGLMSYGPDLPAFFRRIAPLVDMILKGANPGEIPIERPTTFELVVNLAAAEALGIKVPRTILVRATRVIE